MSSLPEFDFNYKKFLDRSTILFGESGTGKSTIIDDMLFQIKPFVGQIVVFCPTDRNNKAYSGGRVPLPCIHDKITDEVLKDIWSRQSALTQVYKRANNPEILRKLFARIQNQTGLTAIEGAKRKQREYENEIKNEMDEGAAKCAIAEMDKDTKKLIELIYKHYINENRSKLLKMNLSKNEQYSIKYLNINPRLVIIFDDCSSQLNSLKKNKVIQDIFYQGRHVYITTFIAIQTDKVLDPELKKNAFVSIFTEESCASAYFERKSNDLDKEAKNRARNACKMAFSPLPTLKHQKLAWVRDEKRFYKLIATKHDDFRFGNPIIWNYCEQIQADLGEVSSDNKFMQDFMD